MTITRNIPKKILCAACLALASAAPMTAQTNGSNSPYSRFGLGLLRDGGSAFNKGMAGTAYGFQDGQELNTLNPASYSKIDSLSFLFDFGLSIQNGNFAQGGVKTNARNTSIDYLTAGYRIAKGFGMSLGLVPFSTVGYSMSSTQTLSTPTGDVVRTQTSSGDGGVHEVFVGLGYAPVKQLAFGVNAGYLWGNFDHTVLSGFDDSNVNSTRQQYVANLRTYKLDFGLQYNQRINKKNSLTLGLTYGLGHDIKRPAYYYNQTISGGSVAHGDTLSCANAYSLPHSFGVGLTWTYNNSLRIGMDYTCQKWSDVGQPTIVDNQYLAKKGYFSDLHKVSLGLEYVPNKEGLRWRQRIRYRLGAGYTTSYVKVNGQDGPESYLVSAGAALPIINMHNNRSFVNLSAQYEHAKPKSPGMITENYIRFSIGLSFNERWFMKWKAE